MGISPFSTSGFDNTENIKSGNPKPNNYDIIDYLEINGHIMLMITYHDCDNYEGNKILVFRNCTKKQLEDQQLIDPHFSDNKNYFSPFARFEPTKEGWRYGEQLLNLL